MSDATKLPFAGSPSPLGPSVSTSPTAINFAVFSQHASAVSLEVFHSNGASVRSFALSKDSNRTGDIWHIAIEGLPKSGVLYGYRVDGEGGWETGHRWDVSKVMLDPYAPLIASRLQFAVRDEVEQFKPKVSLQPLAKMMLFNRQRFSLHQFHASICSSRQHCARFKNCKTAACISESLKTIQQRLSCRLMFSKSFMTSIATMFWIRDSEHASWQDGSIFRGTYDFDSPAFDWGADYQRPNHAPQDLIIYEMGIRSYTAHDSSGLPAGQKGTYLGLKEKVGCPESMGC